MAVDGYLNFDTKLSTKGFNKGLGDINSSFASMKSMLGKLAAAVGVTFSIAGIVSFGKTAVENAAEINAAASQLTQTFGELQSAAEAAMGRVAETSGIVETRLQGVGTSIYAFAKASGMESAEALGMMEEALQVTADSAAYYDRSLEDTAESLKSFLKGNYANDAALGISCTETTRNAAANKLYAKSFSELSEAQKQLVLLQMVKDANDLSGATGQAAREADGWENVLGNLKETWKQLLAVVGQPVLSAAVTVVKSITSELQKLTSVARSAVSALAEVFGIELMNTTGGVADSSLQAADSYADMSESAEQAAEANENSLASFDKINKLSDSSSSSDSGSGAAAAGGLSDGTISTSVDVDTSDADKKLTDFFKRVKSSFNALFEPFKSAWDKNGASVINSAQKTWEGFKGVASSIASSFAEVLSNGTGYEICSEILRICTNIFDTLGNIGKRFAEAWSDGTGTAIVQGLADLLLIALGTIGDCAEATVDWAETLDFTPLLESVAGLLESIEPLADNVGAGLEWFYKNVLLPLVSWTIEDVIPSFLDLLSGAIDVLNSVIEAFKPLGKWLWDKFLEPIAKWTGGVIVSVIEDIAGALKKVSDWISKHKTAVQNFAIVVGTLGAAFKIASIITAATTALTAAGGVMGVLTGITTALGAAFTFLTSPITLVCLAIGAVIAIGVLLVKNWDEVKAFAIGMWESIQEALWSFYDWVVEKFEALCAFFSGLWDDICSIFAPVADWFSEKFTAAWNGIKKAFSSVKSWFSERWTAIKDIFTSVGSWFSEKFTGAWNNIKAAFSSVGTFFSGIWDSIKKPFLYVTDWFKDKFSAAWQAVKDVFSAGGKIFEGIKDGIGSVFTDVVNVLIDGINAVIAAPFNAINDAIGWVRDLTIAGWEPFSGLTELNIPEIPHLAQGTVVPANYGEFLAVLGDNKREAEVVAPESAIERAMENVLSRWNGGGGNITVIAELDGKTVYKNVVKRNNESIRMTGKNPLVPEGAVT